MHLNFDVWAPLGPDNCILGCHTDHIPPRVSDNEPALPRTDGTWGPHDYTTMPQSYDPSAPYLAWCPREPHPDQPFHDNFIMKFTFEEQYYVKNPQNTKLGGLRKDTLKLFVKEVGSLAQMYEINARIAEETSPSVKPPILAVQHMRDSVTYLNLSDIYYRDCQEGVQTLRRNTREVQGFILWARTLSSPLYPKICYLVRGAIALDEAAYGYLCDRNVPAWFVAGRMGRTNHYPVEIKRLGDLCNVTTWRQVPTKDITFVDWEEMAPGIFQIKHSKPIWYYPPIVARQQNFERAARGCGARLDVIRMDKSVNSDLRRLAKSRETLCIDTSS